MLRKKMYIIVSLLISIYSVPAFPASTTFSNAPPEDGSLSVIVDSYGNFGGANPSGNTAIYDPVGTLTAAGTIWESLLFFSPLGTFLSRSYKSTLPDIPFTSESNRLAVSAFDVSGYHIVLTQELSDIGAAGTTLSQTYKITNNTGQIQTFSLVKHVDGDSYYQGDYMEDFGGVSGDGSTVYELDWFTNPQDSTPFLGVLAFGGTPKGYCVDSWQFTDNIIAAGGIPADLLNKMYGDANSDGLTDSFYDVTLSLEQTMTLLPEQTGIFVTHTNWGISPANNHSPIANAGPDQTITQGNLVTLNGTGTTDPDGNPLTYKWVQTGGTPVTLSNAAAASPTFTIAAAIPGEVLTFNLIAADNHLFTSVDTVNITVIVPNTSLAYLAEGYTNNGFKTLVALMNPNAVPARTNVTLMKESDGTTLSYPLIMPAMSRKVIDAGTILPVQGFSTKVESSIQVGVERSMYWPAGAITDAGGHSSFGAPALKTTWYFAEGYNNPNNGFKTYILLQNPNAAQATATVTFMKEDVTNLIYTRVMPPTSRQTIITSASNVIPFGGFSTKVVSTLPIVVERAMYWTAGGVSNAGGHDTVGVSDPATTWYLAEGSNSTTFKTYILLMNPNDTAATATATFWKDDGTTIVYNRAIPAKSRQTIITSASNLIPNGGFATKVTADQPIMVERAMYWTAGGIATADGHDTVAASTLATTWYLAAGNTSSTFDTYILILNPNSTAGQATLTFIKNNGTTVTHQVTLPANRRTTVNVKSVIPSDGFSTIVTATVPIMAERTTYWSAGGVSMAGGNCSIGVPKQTTP